MYNICCFATHGKIVAAHEYVAFRRGKHEDIARKFVDVDKTRMAHVERMLGAIDWEGVANVCFLVDVERDLTWYLETNGRFWASVQGSVNAGWDFPYWAVRYFLHDEIPTPPPVSRKEKITCYHTADLSALIAFLRGGRPPVTVGKVNPWTAIWHYLRAFGPGYQSDVFKWSDPIPALVDHFHFVMRKWNGLVRRFKKRRD